MSLSSFNIGISGMRAYSGALDSSGHNIANASTKNFQPQVASFQENTNGGVIVNLSKTSQQLAAQNNDVNGNDNDLSGSDLSTELTNNLQYKAGFEFSAKIVQVADAMFASLLDIKK